VATFLDRSVSLIDEAGPWQTLYLPLVWKG